LAENPLSLRSWQRRVKPCGGGGEEMVSERPLCEEKVCVGIELVRAPGSCVTGAGGGLRVAKGRIGTVTQEYANGAANIRTRRGRLPAIGLPSVLQSSLSSIFKSFEFTRNAMSPADPFS
jgi:hypothetical protein